MYGLQGADLKFIKGKTLNQVCVGTHQVILNLDDVSISIEGLFTHQANQQMESVMEALPSSARSLLGLLGLSVIEVDSQDDRTLSIKFSNGDLVNVYDSNDTYESYQISFRDKLIVV